MKSRRYFYARISSYARESGEGKRAADVESADVCREVASPHSPTAHPLGRRHRLLPSDGVAGLYRCDKKPSDVFRRPVLPLVEERRLLGRDVELTSYLR